MWHQLVNVNACLTTHCNAFVVWLDKTVRIMIQFIEKNPRPIIHSCMPASASFVRSFIHSLIMTLLLNRQWIHVYLTTMCESCSSMSVHVLWITLRFMSTFGFAVLVLQKSVAVGLFTSHARLICVICTMLSITYSGTWLMIDFVVVVAFGILVRKKYNKTQKTSYGRS